MGLLTDAVAADVGVEVGAVDVDFAVDLGEGDDALVAVVSFKMGVNIGIAQLLKLAIRTFRTFIILHVVVCRIPFPRACRLIATLIRLRTISMSGKHILTPTKQPTKQHHLLLQRQLRQQLLIGAT